MASKTRAELHSELAKLQKAYFEDPTKATFGGLNAEEDAVHQKRAQLIASLVQRLEVLDESSTTLTCWHRCLRFSVLSSAVFQVRPLRACVVPLFGISPLRVPESEDY
jgi:hypothetical protein